MMNIKNKKHILKKFIAMVLIAGVVTVEAGAITASAAEPTNSPMSAIVDQCDFLNVRSGASANDAVVGKINTGDKVEVLELHSNGWIKIKSVDNVTGWVNGDYLTIQGGNVDAKVQNVLNLAFKQQGKPYRWGATGPNAFDCSGFTSYVYKNGAGVNLPRVSRSQATVGKKVSRAELKPGDLVFFGSGGSINHVGLYVGDSKFIHSPQTGDVVKVTSMAPGTNYARRLITATRVLQ
ncbi:TPA: C40 family peptidase [Clostridioides difficile]|nr:C40 family peptidase [Clostridioides difficile]